MTEMDAVRAWYDRTVEAAHRPFDGLTPSERCALRQSYRTGVRMRLFPEIPS